MRTDKIILAVSRGFDIIEGELVGAQSGHSGRVAALAGGIGAALGMGRDELITLSVCALFHDSALTEWVVSGEDNDAHCVMGERNIKTLPLPSDSTGLVLYHHERADGSGLFGLRDIPLGAEIISLADAHDTAKPLDGFSPKILAALERLGETGDTLSEWHLSATGALKLGGIIATAIDYKSKFTRRHTLGIAEKSKSMAAFYGYGEDETAKLYLAACLHDLGKLATPTEILEKPGKLTADEFQIIKDHVKHTHDLLEGVDPDIRHWAAAHHEKLDGTGYPFGLGADELHFNAQLMSCIDIYQAVSEERPYHPARSHGETIGIMQRMAANGTINESIVRDIDSVLKESAI
jgi:HD-GYP domain-containing protein (c-di-GMP phosphodiesterase class II)